MNRYSLRKEPEYDTPWIALPNNGGDVGDMADITCELNKLLGNYEVTMDERDELRDAMRTLLKAWELYGMMASVTHPRLTRALSAARKLLPENASVMARPDGGPNT